MKNLLLIISTFLEKLDSLQFKIVKDSYLIINEHRNLQGKLFGGKLSDQSYSTLYQTIEPLKNTYEVNLNAIFYLRKIVTDFKASIEMLDYPNICVNKFFNNLVEHSNQLDNSYYNEYKIFLKDFLENFIVSVDLLIHQPTESAPTLS